MYSEILSKYGSTYVCVSVSGTITQVWNGLVLVEAIDPSHYHRQIESEIIHLSSRIYINTYLQHMTKWIRGNVTWLSSLQQKQQLERIIRLALSRALHIFTSPWHHIDFTWSLVHHTISTKLLGKRSAFVVFFFWSFEPLLWFCIMFPLFVQPTYP